MTTARTPNRLGSIARAIRAAAFAVSAALIAPAAFAGIATFANDCATPKATFVLGETVCAKADALNGLRLAWLDPDGFIVQTRDVTADPQVDSFAIPATGQSSIAGLFIANNVGSWRINALTSRSSVKEATFFTVKDPDISHVDLAVVNDVVGSDAPTPGARVQYEITLLNSGPDSAVNAQFVDGTVSNATFDSLTQTAGPPFACTGATCTVAAFPAGAVAKFLLTVTAGTAGGILENTATFTSDTVELRPADNSTAAPPLRVASGGTPPSCNLECGGNLVVSANTTQNGTLGAIVMLSTPEAFGSCGPVTLSPASGSFFAVGTTTVTATAGDGICSFTVTVINTPPPTISCPSDIAVTALSRQVEAFVPDPAGVGSNPGNASATGSNVSVIAERSDDRPLSDAFPVGLTTIVWTATDDGGRTARCTQRVNVTSADAPSIRCAGDKTFTAPGGACAITLRAEDIGLPLAGGADPVVTSRRSDNLGLADPFPAGDTSITWTATNEIGLASCVQVIHVRTTRTQPPVLNVPPDVTVTTASCLAILDDELGVATATGSCTVNVVRTGVPANFAFPTGTTEVKYTATDGAGNVTTGIQHIRVLESPEIRPTIVPPADVTVSTGAGATKCGVVVSDGTLGSATASDNCSGVSVSRTGVPDSNFFPVGANLVTYTAIDASGNTSTATQRVTVLDTMPPALTCPVSLTLEPTCPAGAVAAWTAPVATDNCAATTTQTAGLSSGSVFAIGSTTTISYTAADAAGNLTSCSFTVQVLTIADTITKLKASVSSSSLNGPTKQGLLPKLDSALDALGRGKSDQACQMIRNFANSTQNFITHGEISTAVGQPWLTSAAHVTNALGCTSDPCSNPETASQIKETRQ